MDVILETKNLRKEFGGLVAVDDVSIQVGAHTLHSIIGPNGAGKTTLFNLLSGVFPPTHGKVIFKGQDITHLPPHRMAHLGIGRSFQITNIFPNLTVLENIRLAAQAMGRDNFKLFIPANRLARLQRQSAGGDPAGRPGRQRGQPGAGSAARRQAQAGTGHHAGHPTPSCCCWMNPPPACLPSRCRRCSRSSTRSWRWGIKPSSWWSTAWIW